MDCTLDKETGAEFLIDFLVAQKIEYIFGIPGRAIEPLYNSLARRQKKGEILPVISRHESGAAFMAAGYAVVSGKIGVCCSTAGPGATNLLTGVSSAYENRIPLLAITAQTESNRPIDGAFQDSSELGINTVGMFSHCTRFNSHVTHVNQLQSKLYQATYSAIINRSPSHLSIPSDILNNYIAISPSSSIPYRFPEFRLEDKAMTEVLFNIISQRKCLFLLGSQCFDAISEIINVATRLNMEISTTPDGKGLIDSQHPLYRGVLGFGGHTDVLSILERKDLEHIIAVGTTLGEWSTGAGRHNLIEDFRLIHVESDIRYFSRSPNAYLHIHGNIASIFQTLGGLLAENKPTPPNTLATAPSQPAKSNFLKSVPQQSVESAGQAMSPRWIFSNLSNLLPESTRYFADIGNSTSWAVHCLPISHNQTQLNAPGHDLNGSTSGINQSKLHVAIEFGSMGWAIGATIGASFADPNNTHVCITGDGSLLMSGQELTVALQHSLPVIFIVLNDSSLGMVEHGQRLAGAEPIGFELPSVDFSEFSKSMGVRSYRVQSASELLDIDFKKICNTSEPVLLDIIVDRNEVPPMRPKLPA